MTNPTATERADTPADTKTVGRSHPRGAMDISNLVQRFALVAVWAVLVVVLSLVLGDSFLNWNNFGSMFSSQTVLLFLALALLPPLTAGDFDLSVAGVLTMSGVLLANLTVNEGWSLAPAILVTLAMAAGIGLFNGLLIVLFDIESLIVTLGTSTFLTGTALWVTQGSIISGVPEELTEWTLGRDVAGISVQFYYGILLAAILWFVLEFTPTGRRLLFVGRGRTVAQLTGVKVGRMRVGALVLSAFLAGLAGVVYVGTTGGADPVSGASFLFPAFAAVFLGSTTFRPGRFNAFGTVIALYFLVTGITGLQQLGAETYVQNLFYGSALLLAVVVSSVVRKRRERAST